MNTRHLAGTLLCLVIVVGACGDDEQDASPVDTRGGAATAATVDQAATPTGEQAATRTIEHAAGTTEVPVDAQRIVTLQDQNALLPLLELGVKPVASAGLISDDGSESFRRTEGFDTSGIEFIGAYGEPNLEAIAAVRPDLIVSDEFSADGVYDELSAIAPTVYVQVFERPLTDALTDFAEVVGEEERAQELRAEYEGRIEEVGGRSAMISTPRACRCCPPVTLARSTNPTAAARRSTR